jgi:DNA (cytosine-5)-methyltransferase 1
VRRPRVLDLYCGQGGASVGYHLAGFDVIGVDTKPQPQYPFPFIRRDSLAVLRDDRLLSEIDVIHASPPCQSESQLRFLTKKTYQDLLTPTLELLFDLEDIPWVVENHHEDAVEHRALRHPLQPRRIRPGPQAAPPILRQFPAA